MFLTHNLLFFTKLGCYNSFKGEMSMKKICSIFCMLILMSITLVGCYNGKLCFADNSVTQTTNIDVKYKGNEQKVFIYGVDSNARIVKYGELGEVTMIKVSVWGKTTLNDLKNSTTGIDESGIPTNDVSKASYFTDWFKIKIRLPKNYEKVNILDGKGPVLIDRPKQVEDDYFIANLEWVRLNKDKTVANLVTDEGEDDRFLFYEFLDKNNNVLTHYFVHIEYSVVID